MAPFTRITDGLSISEDGTVATIGSIARMERLIAAVRERITRPGLGSVDLNLQSDLAELFAEFDGNASSAEKKAREDHARDLEIVAYQRRKADELQEYVDRKLADRLSGLAGCD